MRTRAGRYSAQKSRELQWDLIVRMWPILTIGFAATIALAVCTQFIAHGWQAGFDFAGITVAGVAALAIVVLESSGSLGAQMGSEAERWTEHELRKLQRLGCAVVSHIPLENRDIDHAVLTPTGAWAVETKWSARSWGDIRDARLRDAINGARRSAQQLGHLLASREIGVPMPVEPLVIIWGDWGDLGKRIDSGVPVVRGKDLSEWRRARASASGAFDVAQARKGIQAWLAKRDQHIRDRDKRPAIVRVGPTLLGLQILVGVIATTAGGLFGAILGTLSQFAVATIAVITATLVGLLARRSRALKLAATAWSTGLVFGAAIAIWLRLAA